MKKIILLAAIVGLFEKSIAQQAKCNVTVTLDGTRLQLNVVSDEDAILNHDDSSLIYMIGFAVRKLDATLINEEIRVYPDNGKGVAVMEGATHKIFFAVRKNGEYVILLLGGRRPVGGVLKTMNDEWVLDSQEISENGIYTFVGDNKHIHGRFEFHTKQIAEVEFNDGL